jgi:16S rRNA (cytidine1402-2'-O)-methyltransferase
MSKLTLVPTPIGNLKDITFRALEVLANVDLILAEDTRTTGKLLKHYEVEKSMLSFHIHNEHRVLKSVIQRLKDGAHLALVSDAGTPGISDPGFLLVRSCVEEGITVESLPGATAFVPALVNSGFPTDRFCFEGFLPHKKGRLTRITELREEMRTIILYESPHRIRKTLMQLAEHLGADRMASISRELTKIHEETIRGTLAELAAHFDEHAPKGEFVLVIKGFEN